MIFESLFARKKESTVKGTESYYGLSSLNVLKKKFAKSTNTDFVSPCLAYVAFSYKTVCKHFGESKANELQHEAAKTLLDVSNASITVARLDNGVFLLSMICPDGLQAERSVEDLTTLLNRKQKILLVGDLAPFRAGIFLASADKPSFDTALANAQIGYSYARAENRFVLTCTPDILQREAIKNKLRDKLLQCLKDGQFEMYLQFIYNVKENRCTGAEALSRWHNPDEGVLMPSYYIRDMQQTGVIEQFDYYMLRKICSLLQEWSNTEFSGLTLSCNITRITLSSDKFKKNLESILNDYTFDRNKLILEITEDSLIDDRQTARENLAACKKAGLQIAIDGYGEGSTSIDDIRDFSVDYVKIDRQLIAESKKNSALLSTLIEQAHSQNLQVVCEGVETKQEKDSVLKKGTDFIQGYLFSYVLSVDEAKEQYLKSLNA